MSKSVRQAVAVPTHFLVADGTDEASNLGYTSVAQIQGQFLGDLAVPLVGTGVLTVPAGESLSFYLSAYDSYSTYTLTVSEGTAVRTGNTILYTAPAYACTDTLTVAWGDIERTLTFTVTLNQDLITAPDAPPSLGDALGGGYYAGAIWDTVTSASGELAIGLGEKVFTVPATPHDFYFGQELKIAPGPTNAGQVFMYGTVADRDETSLTVNITSIDGTGTFSAWVLAARYKIIVAPKSGGENASVMYKNANSAAPTACFTLTNGLAATDAMIAADTSTVYPLAHWAKALRELNDGEGLSGYTDWYIPARDELELLWRNLKPVTNGNYTTQDRPNAAAYTIDANLDDALPHHGINRNSDPAGAAYTTSDPAQTSVAAFKTGGAEAMAFGSSYYWSSSEFSASDALYQDFYSSSPGRQYIFSKSYSGRARAVRRLIL
jgi:hypothetical protein